MKMTRLAWTVSSLLSVVPFNQAFAYTHSVDVGAFGTEYPDQGGNAGAEYHHFLDGFAPGDTWTIRGNEHVMHDPMIPDHSFKGVGQQSWCQSGICAGAAGNSLGWNHTAQHVLLNLTQGTDVTITLSDAPSVEGTDGPNEENTGALGDDLIPGFTLFRGRSTQGWNPVTHTFANQSNFTPNPLLSAKSATLVPATAPDLIYFEHDANTANKSSITQTYHLDAGYWSLWIGGNIANTPNEDADLICTTKVASGPAAGRCTGYGGNGKNFELTIAAAALNTPPTANAGTNQTARPGDTVTLDGSGSTDPNHPTGLQYQWSQVSGPQAALTGADTTKPTFTAPAGTGELKFQLVVSDPADGQDSEPSEVAVTLVENHPPTLILTPTKTVTENSTVTLSPQAAADDDGDSLTYAWTQTGGTEVALSGANSANLSFTAPLVGDAGETLSFNLTVTDDYAPAPKSTTASVTVAVTNDTGLLDCSQATATPNSLFPANKKMKKVSVGGITSPSDYTLTITKVTQDEPVKFKKVKDSTGPDAKILKGTKKKPLAQQSVSLRAEFHKRVKNAGSNNGRVYTIAFNAADGSQNCAGAVQVHVPKAAGQLAVDDGGSYDSTKKK